MSRPIANHPPNRTRAHRWRRVLMVVVTIVAVAAWLLKNQAVEAAPVQRVFTFVGTDQPFVVPGGVTSISIKAWGAGGAGNNNGASAAAGGFAGGTLAVTPGETLTVVSSVAAECSVRSCRPTVAEVPAATTRRRRMGVSGMTAPVAAAGPPCVAGARSS